MQNSVKVLGETFFICWITLPADLKKRDWKKKKKKLVWRQIDDKFPNIGILLFPWKNVMLLFVKFLTYVIMQCYLIKKSSLANITWVWKITVFYDHWFLILKFSITGHKFWTLFANIHKIKEGTIKNIAKTMAIKHKNWWCSRDSHTNWSGVAGLGQ